MAHPNGEKYITAVTGSDPFVQQLVAVTQLAENEGTERKKDVIAAVCAHPNLDWSRIRTVLFPHGRELPKHWKRDVIESLLVKKYPAGVQLNRRKTSHIPVNVVSAIKSGLRNRLDVATINQMVVREVPRLHEVVCAQWVRDVQEEMDQRGADDVSVTSDDSAVHDRHPHRSVTEVGSTAPSGSVTPIEALPRVRSSAPPALGVSHKDMELVSGIRREVDALVERASAAVVAIQTMGDAEDAYHQKRMRRLDETHEREERDHQAALRRKRELLAADNERRSNEEAYEQRSLERIERQNQLLLERKRPRSAEATDRRRPCLRECMLHDRHASFRGLNHNLGAAVLRAAGTATSDEAVQEVYKALERWYVERRIADQPQQQYTLRPASHLTRRLPILYTSHSAGHRVERALVDWIVKHGAMPEHMPPGPMEIAGRPTTAELPEAVRNGCDAEAVWQRLRRFAPVMALYGDIWRGRQSPLSQPVEQPTTVADAWSELYTGATTTATLRQMAEALRWPPEVIRDLGYVARLARKLYPELVWPVAPSVGQQPCRYGAALLPALQAAACAVHGFQLVTTDGGKAQLDRLWQQLGLRLA